MNLQRREEIRELVKGLDSFESSAATECKTAILELLAHIDTLEQTAAERVIARGAVVKPHTFGEIVNQVRDIASQYAGTEQLREQITYALAPHFERDGGPTPDYTGEGSAWVPPEGARGVVVPLGDTFTLDLDEFGKSLARITINSKNRGVGYRLCGTMGDGHFSRRTFDITPYLGHCLNLIGIRAIPADRLLGEGMVAVDREEWMAINEFADKIVPIRDNISGISWVGKLSDVFEAYDQWYAIRIAAGVALRANQGGSAT